jgi:hypothetical protein
MIDELEALLKQAKKERHLKRISSTAPKVVIKRQAEMEWVRGKTLCLIHRAEDGTETALGLFIEYTRNGSRWLRPTTETLSPDCSEIVTGSWWVNPRIREIPFEDTPEEVAAIRARFESLMTEFEKENGMYTSEPPLNDTEDDFHNLRKFGDNEDDFEDEELEIEDEDEDEDDFEIEWDEDEE